MKSPLFVGAVTAVVVLVIAAIWTGMALVPPADQAAALQSAKDTEISRRNIVDHSQALQLLKDEPSSDGKTSALDNLKTLDFVAIQQELETIEDLAAELRDDQSPSALRSKITELAKTVEANEKILLAAGTAAENATRYGKASASAHLMKGLVELIQAQGSRFNEQRYRRQLDALYTEAFQIIGQRDLEKIEENYYIDINIDPIIADLSNDEHGLEWVKTSITETEGQIDELEGKIQALQVEYDAALDQLKAKQAQRIALQDQGYEVGNDSSFEMFRQQYDALTQEVKALQAQVDAFLYGTQADGTPRLGLEALKREIELKTAYRDDLKTASQNLTTAIENVEVTADNARAMASVRTADVEKRKEAILDIIAKIRGTEEQAGLIQKADTAHSRATEHAVNAINAFKKASSAVEKMQSAARQTRRDQDPEKLNKALTQIINDKTSIQITKSAEVSARLLLAEIKLGFISGQEKYLTLFERIVSSIGGDFNRGSRREDLDNAITVGQTHLDEAITHLQAMQDSADVTVWIPQTTLAIAYLLKAQYVPADAEQYQHDALAMLDEAVTGREASPYLADVVRFRRNVYAWLGEEPVDRKKVDEATEDDSDFGEGMEEQPTEESDESEATEEKTGDDFGGSDVW